jgi:mercuric ion transport protein
MHSTEERVTSLDTRGRGVVRGPAAGPVNVPLLSSGIAPQPLSHHKQWVFTVGLLIASNFFYFYVIAPKFQMSNGACDPNDPVTCQTASRYSRMVLWCSAGLYLVGCFTAFVLGPLLVWFDQ